jgi:hypothetical protein
VARPLRVRFDGALYLIIIQGINRCPLFRDRRDKAKYLEVLRKYRGQFCCRLYAYALLDRIVFLLIETPRGNISRIMQCVGTSYASYFNRRYRRRGGLFEGRFKSLLVDKERGLAELTRYIHRSHLLLSKNKKRDSQWSSYPVYLGKRESDLVDSGPVLTRLGFAPERRGKQYKDFVENGDSKKGLTRRWTLQNGIGSDLEVGLALSAPSRSVGDQLYWDEAKRIFREVSQSFDYPVVIEDGRRKKSEGALVRHLAMYLIRRNTALSLESIGSLWGIKASAVSLAIARIERLLRQEEFHQIVSELPKVQTLLVGMLGREYLPNAQDRGGEANPGESLYG